jgi:long-chain acyl-CoA synthetase
MAESTINAPWLAHYDSVVPKSIGKYPDSTLVDFVARHAQAKPDSVALAFKGSHLTFREIDQASDALAHALRARGVGKGDRVAFLLPNAPQFIIAELAVWKLGGVIVPQNPIYTERELEESLATTKPQTMIVLTPFYQRVKNIQPRTSLKRIIATNIKEYLPTVLRILFTLVKEKKEGHRVSLQSGDEWFGDLIKEGMARGKFVSLAQPDEVSMILMSGGTTGTPKGVLSTHRGMVMSGMQLSAWLKDALSGKDASIMLPLPLFHTYGCAGAQSITLTSGVPLILVPNPRDLADLLKTVNREKPALLCGVPTLFSAMINHPLVQGGKVDIKSIKACFSGAAALMAETKKRFEELSGGRIVEGYSLTEATMACCANPMGGENKIGSIGVPVPDVFVRIVDAEDASKEMPTGEVGEVSIHAPQLMLGYFENDTETSMVLRTDAEGRRWLYTGDLGYMDADGYIFLVDRKKDLIKTSGFQVWPREIEEVIVSHPDVSEVGVAGFPDPQKGEVVIAWVVPRPGAEVTEETLRAYCREKLAPYKVPAKIRMRTELPKTMVGKVLRRVLVAEEKSSA